MCAREYLSKRSHVHGSCPVSLEEWDEGTQRDVRLIDRYNMYNVIIISCLHHDYSEYRMHFKYILINLCIQEFVTIILSMEV